jgi:hypothetical protein
MATVQWNDFLAEFIRDFIRPRFQYDNLAQATKDEMIDFLENLNIDPTTLFGPPPNALPAPAVPHQTKAKFVPQHSGENIDDFFKRLMAFFTVNRVRDQDKTGYLLSGSLPAVAKFVTDLISAGTTAFPDLKDRVIGNFGQSPFRRLDNFLRLRKFSSETFIQFGARLRQEYEGFLTFTDQQLQDNNPAIKKALLAQLLQIISPGLKAHLHQLLLDHPNTDFQDVLKAADAYADAHKPTQFARHPSTAQNKPTQQPDSSSSSGPKCFRCQQPGHFANNCPNSSQSNQNLGNASARMK